MASQMGLLITMVIVILIVKGSSATIYTVGDDFGWNIPPNATFYSEWANSKTFQIGDQVEFNMSGTNESVGEVLTLTEYNNCTDPGLVILNPLIFTPTLKSKGSRFFISSIGDHCELGTKVIITVGSPTNISSLVSGSSRLLLSPSLGSLVATIVVVFFNYV